MTAGLLVARDLQTPKALRTCSPQTISAACSAFLPEPTVTVTETITHYPCTTTSKVTQTIYDHTVYTSTYTQYGYPPASVIDEPSTAVLTKTVPWACAQTYAYMSPSDGNNTPPGTNVYALYYPYLPLTDVECCALCYEFTNCIASSFLLAVLSCELLINGELKTNDKSELTKGPGGCPAGIFDYEFGPRMVPTDEADGNIYIYPGPCGR